MTRSSLLCIAPLVILAANGCGPTDVDVHSLQQATRTQVPSRHTAVLVDGCVLDTWQRSTLRSPETRRVVDEVIMLCLVPRVDGEVGPRDPSARSHLATLGNELRELGYRMHLGVAFTDETGQRYDGAQTANFLASESWRAKFRETLPDAVSTADGVEIALQFLPDAARASVTSLVREVSQVVRPLKQLNVHVPPSVTEPSDLPGGDAFSVSELAEVTDRIRVMTLDYSETSPGPTIDPGWAVDAVRLAKTRASVVDISYPLYAVDFGPHGRRYSTYNDARAVELVSGAPAQRGITGAGFVRYQSASHESHEIWFDDAASTTRALGAWTYEVLPPDVGVLLYGLGAEDPILFQTLSARTPE